MQKSDKKFVASSLQSMLSMASVADSQRSLGSGAATGSGEDGDDDGDARRTRKRDADGAVDEEGEDGLDEADGLDDDADGDGERDDNYLENTVAQSPSAHTRGSVSQSPSPRRSIGGGGGGGAGLGAEGAQLKELLSLVKGMSNRLFDLEHQVKHNK